MLYPLTFHPIFQERIWGGRKLEELYQKALPPNIHIGESWEICDRPEASSIITNGPFAGKDLHWLMQHHRADLLGAQNTAQGRFPLLVKILDAREKLSLQVHPPAKIAAQLGGEPKTEMWYFAHAEPEARVYAGLRRGVTRDEFQVRLASGTVSECFHRLPVRPGDALFLPSGRVHGIGGGNVIFEIQQNSDTTYRVFDWNRVGLDGKPRALHIQESLLSINFEDFEPSLIKSQYSRSDTIKVRYLVDDALFSVDGCQVKRGERFHLRSAGLQILGVLHGRLEVQQHDSKVTVTAGGFVLLPASLERVSLTASKRTEFLHVQLP